MSLGIAKLQSMLNTASLGLFNDKIGELIWEVWVFVTAQNLSFNLDRMSWFTPTPRSPQTHRSTNLHKGYLLPCGTHVSHQGLLPLAPLVHPVQSAGTVNVIDPFYVLHRVQVTTSLLIIV